MEWFVYTEKDKSRLFSGLKQDRPDAKAVKAFCSVALREELRKDEVVLELARAIMKPLEWSVKQRAARAIAHAAKIRGNLPPSVFSTLFSDFSEPGCSGSRFKAAVEAFPYLDDEGRQRISEMVLEKSWRTDFIIQMLIFGKQYLLNERPVWMPPRNLILHFGDLAGCHFDKMDSRDAEHLRKNAARLLHRLLKVPELTPDVMEALAIAKHGRVE